MGSDIYPRLWFQYGKDDRHIDINNIVDAVLTLFPNRYDLVVEKLVNIQKQLEKAVPMNLVVETHRSFMEHRYMHRYIHGYILDEYHLPFLINQINEYKKYYNIK